MHTSTLLELARLHRNETLRRAAAQRRARLVRRPAPWRRSIANVLTAAGERMLTLGASLAD